MKKITFLLLAVFIAAFSYSQNKIQNPGFEGDLTTFTVDEGGFDVIMRVAGHQDAVTQAASPTVSPVVSVVDGMWVRKAPNSGYIKGVVRDDLSHPSGGSGANRVLNLRHNQNNAATGLTNWYQNVLQQRVAGGVDLTEQYYLSFDAKVDDETSPTLTNVLTQVVAVIRDLDKNLQTTQTIQLTKGTDWNKYSATFNLPAWVAGGGAGAEGTNVIFGIGIATEYEDSKTKYASVLLDNIILSIDPASGMAASKQKKMNYTVDNGVLTLVNPVHGVTVHVFNLTGSLVSKTISTGRNISLPLSQGIYVVKAGNVVEKVIVK